MPSSKEILNSIQESGNGLSLAELLVRHPDIARRTAQRLIAKLIESGQISAQGEGRARRYFGTAIQPETTPLDTDTDSFPSFIPLSADSWDILAYINQPPEARKPVGYQRDFLETYQPNVTSYLPESLRRQLHRMGKTTDTVEPAGTYSRAVLNRLLIDLSWASSHLEGNTYSRLDTRQLIEHGKAARGKAAIETQMILNHKTAIELLVENIESAEFNRYTLMNLHSALAENLLPNPADEGRIRQHAVDIGKSTYRPLSTPQQIEDTLEVLLNKANQITDPFEQSFFMMVHLPYLQPFADINKRTSRLAANLPLFRANLCPLTFLDVPEQAYSRATLGVYEMTRVELLRDLYLWAYERSTQEYLAIKQDLAEPDPLRLTWRDFIKMTIRKVVTHPELDPLACIQSAVAEHVSDSEQSEVQALIVEELRRLHEGVLARYGLRPSEFILWKSHHGN
ncbi:TPA: Fic family protein [Pseudomonas aeruginosa]|uniref:Fic family protein n=2 Tax=Pseudomonas aeruginosa TaxID=287 RepID=UPI002117959B|nr:Fic family protein [Pseudomonas aeruginosa]HBN8495884.1 Fic family protein [Pseudomonas aeruginosa]HBN8499692.1 Fic family protein [Pseudomonas aeruginosa]HCH7657993.1 Fic family protein [Pseudomonas aeruginosa]HCH7672831.1 Fic family protein [Pseudomonas aeruginosa]HCH9724184.1 Fic family protein [Pseudomonas aeruginosa]